MKPSNTCVECGKQTANPRFCSQSCAAKYNNRTSPKRKPEGACTKCGSPVVRRKKLCDNCEAEVKRAEAAQRQKEEETRQREEQGMKEWRTIGREPKPAPVSKPEQRQTPRPAPIPQPGAMFTLELDLVCSFAPLMGDQGDGIRLTRTLELPFPPYEGLNLQGGGVDDATPPQGLPLENVIWDLDRKLFLAEVEYNMTDLPVEAIPLEIEGFMNVGWRLGSYADCYTHNFEETEEEEEHEDRKDAADQSLFEKWSEQSFVTESPARRPPAFNRFMKALISPNFPDDTCGGVY